jgi:hypothetical protein
MSKENAAHPIHLFNNRDSSDILRLSHFAGT